MRSYGLYDTTRGLMTALAVGVAGLLLWVATQVGQQSAGRFWGEMGIVAAAGLVLAVLPGLGSRAPGLRFRFSPGMFLLGFLPTLVLVGWILMATQPGRGWHDGTVASWSRDIGIMGLVHDIGLWHGVLAFGFGLVLGRCFHAAPALERDEAVVDRRRRRDGAAAGPRGRQRPTAEGAGAATAAALPRREEREAAARAEPHTVAAGPAVNRDRDELAADEPLTAERDEAAAAQGTERDGVPEAVPPGRPIQRDRAR